MNIKELTPKMGNVELVAEVAEIGEVREFNKFGKSGKVATAKLKDSTGEIEMALWNEQIDQLGKGDTVKITNGYVKEYQGEMQLTTGMRGTIELVKKSEIKSGEKPAAAKEQTMLKEANEPVEKPASDEELIED